MITPSIRFVTLLGCAWFAAAASAQDNRGNDSRSGGDNPGRHQARTGGGTEQVRVTRATTFLGSDVIGTDGRKVGDIVDYYFNLGESPRLEYVVLMTGGFLDMGGDRRAVPASAISMSDETCRIDVASDRYWDLPVLPENRDRFLADNRNRRHISQFFSGSERRAEAGGTARDRNSDSRTDATRTGGGASDRGGQQLVSFNALRNTDAYGSGETRLGYFVDACINVNDNRAPYMEITPTFQPFRTNFDRRFAIPTAKLEERRDPYGFSVALTASELNDAKYVSEKEGVKMLEEGRFGDTVLRVTLPER